MLNDRFAIRPFGWPPLETALLLTRMLVAGEIQFLMGGEAIPRDRIYEQITTPGKWRNITVIQRVMTSPAEVTNARNLGRELFAAMGPDSEEELHAFLKTKFGDWLSDLNSFKALADTGEYPGKQEIEAALEIVKTMIAIKDSNQFLPRFNSNKDDLLDVAENYQDLAHFYGPQKPTWDKLRSAFSRFTLNRMELERHEEASNALQRMHEILNAPAPYGLIQEAEGLIDAVTTVNTSLINERRISVLHTIDSQIEIVQLDLTSTGGDQSLTDSCLGALQRLKAQVSSGDSLAHLAQAESEAVNLKDVALEKIRAYMEEQSSQNSSVEDKPRIKETQVIKPAQVSTKVYLESSEDIDQFLDALRKQLEEAISSDKRIEIR